MFINRTFTSSFLNFLKSIEPTLKSLPKDSIISSRTSLLMFNSWSSNIWFRLTLNDKKFLNNYGHVIDEYLVVGHTDTKGTNKYNLSLSIKRAEVVKEILINYGINQSSIKILGKGEESLAVDTPDDTKQPANRRVEIKKQINFCL